ncbi:MAG: hypothetical protein IT199_04475 [Solirubrobacterales bacterium]|nr:hypothetical protein [Solirubrobacterales bacterium]
MQGKVKFRAGLGVIAVSLLAALATMPAAATAGRGDMVDGRFSTCFWNYGAFGVNDFNIAYPDAGATYWAAGFRRPPGSKLTLSGRFPHSRYMAIQSYDILGRGVDGLADYQINPDPGSVNPFRPGASRTARKRSYKVNVIDAKNPGLPLEAFDGEPRRNSIYVIPDAGPITENADSQTFELNLLMMRVYVPDKGTDLTGGVGLPEPTLTLANGTVLKGQALCDAVDSESRAIGHTRVPDPGALLISTDTYRAMRYPNELVAPLNVFGGLMSVPREVPAWFPAVRQGKWRAQYDRRYLLQLWTGDDAPGAVAIPPARGAAGGFFPNVHNAYVRTALNRKFGKVAVFRGKLPTSPRTRQGNRKMGAGQVRYTSFCMNEAPQSTKVTDCAYDEQIPTDRKGYYTIVVSRAADRPVTARNSCGKAWIRWSNSGDGDLDHDFGWFQIRNMLPSRSFRHAIQLTSTPGDEAGVVGPYLPKLKYYADGNAFGRSAMGGCSRPRR